MNHYNQNNANENQILLIIKKERKTFRVDFVCLSHLQRHHLIKKEAFKMSFITMKTTHKILIWPVSAVLGKKKRFQKASSRLSSSAGQRGWSPRPASGPVTRVCSRRPHLCAGAPRAASWPPPVTRRLRSEPECSSPGPWPGQAGVWDALLAAFLCSLPVTQPRLLGGGDSAFSPLGGASGPRKAAQKGFFLVPALRVHFSVAAQDFKAFLNS